MNLLHLRRAVLPGMKTSAAGCLAGTMLVLCLGAGLFLLAPEGDGRKSHRVPAGQFSADIRSLFAAVRYLIDPVGDEPHIPVTRGRAGTFALRPLMLPHPLYGDSSNQVAMPEPFTNRPARS